MKLRDIDLFGSELNGTGNRNHGDQVHHHLQFHDRDRKCGCRNRGRNTMWKLNYRQFNLTNSLQSIVQ